ncbi:MAG: RtcB family protein, partial [Bacteroidota bacterium]
MKKLKLRGKELKRIGYRDDQIISLALNIIMNNFKRTEKLEVLEILEKILYSPGSYKDHPVFGQVAQALTTPVKEKRIKNKAKEEIYISRGQQVYYKIYGKDEIEPGALVQMDAAMNLPVSVKGALMADAHSGYGLPIGGVLATKNAVIPYGVGVDIGCRMCMSIYDINSNVFEKKKDMLTNILIENTRFGKAEFKDIGEHEVLERKVINQIPILKELKDKTYSQLGSSGGGNHFVDMGVVEIPMEAGPYLSIKPGKYLAVLSHSGSRNLGARIADHYTHVAKEKRGLPKGYSQLAWLDLDEEEGHEYWLAMSFAGDYSSANHHIIHDKIARSLGEQPMKMIENHHNFAWKEKMDNDELIIHRKGATPAGKGDLGIIPGSMASPAYIVMGKGN